MRVAVGLRRAALLGTLLGHLERDLVRAGLELHNLGRGELLDELRFCCLGELGDLEHVRDRELAAALDVHAELEEFDLDLLAVAEARDNGVQTCVEIKILRRVRC